MATTVRVIVRIRRFLDRFIRGTPLAEPVSVLSGSYTF